MSLFYTFRAIMQYLLFCGKQKYYNFCRFLRHNRLVAKIMLGICNALTIFGLVIGMVAISGTSGSTNLGYIAPLMIWLYMLYRWNDATFA